MVSHQRFVLTHKDNLKEHFLIDLHKLLVPLINVGSLLSRIRVVIGGRRWIGAMVLAPFNHFVQHRLIDLCSHSQRLHHSEVCSGRCTLGIGIASLMASSPISSIMFLIRIDRSATSRSAVPQSLENTLVIWQARAQVRTNTDLGIIRALQLDDGGGGRHLVNESGTYWK